MYAEDPIACAFPALSSVYWRRLGVRDQGNGKPGGGPTQFKGGRGHSGDAQLQENGRPRKSTFEDPPPWVAARPFGNWHSKALVHCAPDMLQLQLNL
jgi:hypothetical protein